jgi:cytochrome P450
LQFGGMLGSTENTPAFYPPRVKPSSRPLRFPFNLAKLIRNSLELIPEQAYREPLVIAAGPPRMAFFTGTELVKALLLDRAMEFPKGALQVGALAPMFGKAMISAEGPEWRWQRGAAAPMFRHEELLGYAPIMSAAAETIVAKWRAAPPGAIHAVHRDMMRAVFDVISKTMLAGVPEDLLGTIEKGNARYYRSVNWWLLCTMLGLPHWLPRPGGKAMREHEQRLREAVAELVLARRASGMTGEDVLSRMLRACDPESGMSMSDDLIVDNVLAFLVGGSDTTAFALTWTLYLISQSPDWERRMIDEIDRVVGCELVSSRHVDHLVTVQQILNESLRLFPPTPVIVRDIVRDVEFDGVSIPAGTIGIIPIYAIHRHQSYWDDPHRFDPGRFASGARSKSSRFRFLPFGAGPRICIGAAFATIQATIMLATFVRAARFEVSPDFDPQPSAGMFLVPKKGMPMRVTLRDRAA